jgi:hypothetical protein
MTKMAGSPYLTTRRISPLNAVRDCVIRIYQRTAPPGADPKALFRNLELTNDSKKHKLGQQLSPDGREICRDKDRIKVCNEVFEARRRRKQVVKYSGFLSYKVRHHGRQDSGTDDHIRPPGHRGVS